MIQLDFSEVALEARFRSDTLQRLDYLAKHFFPPVATAIWPVVVLGLLSMSQY